MPKRQHQANTLRIIGGQWRGRKVQFPNSENIRPTPDRVRETLFNWLRPHIHGANCLDVCAGSGALGLEALSQGANSVCFIDKSRSIIAHLQQVLSEFGANNAECLLATLPDSSLRLKKPADIAFLDPSYHPQLIGPLCGWLIEQHCLTSNAQIYFEYAADEDSPELPETWKILNKKQAGQVIYCLVQS